MLNEAETRTELSEPEHPRAGYVSRSGHEIS